MPPATTLETQVCSPQLVEQIAVASIAASPRNPRQRLNRVDELAESMGTHGLLQPVVVRRVRGNRRYQVIAGHRRLEAAKALGWIQVPAIVQAVSERDAEVLTLVENLQRENLTPREEADALGALVRERRWSFRQVAEAVRRSPSYVSRRLRVFEDPDLGPLVTDGRLAVSTAEELLRAPNAETRQWLAADAAAASWTPAMARRAVSEVAQASESQHPRALASRLRALRQDLTTANPDALPEGARRELARLVKLTQALLPAGI